MSIFSKLFGKKQAEEETTRVGGMEDFMTLIRVYYQAVMATNIGISNIIFLQRDFSAIPNLLFCVGIFNVRLNTAISGKKLMLLIPILVAITA